MQLRNPHGAKQTTLEWTGDWGDDSDQWTTKAKATLNYEPMTEDQTDGIFWMNHVDFLSNFSYLYACRILSGWNKMQR